MKHPIAITMGDASGIGPEIVVKSLNHFRIYENCVPIVIGDRLPLEDAVKFTGLNLRLHEINDVSEAKATPGTIDYFNFDIIAPGSWEYKRVCKISGESSYKYIEKATALAMKKDIDAIVTAPINKEAINLAGYHYSGHTEILADLTKTKSCAMLLVSDSLRVIHVTTHVSMRDACDIIRNGSDRITQVILLADEAMRLLSIENPRIAVAGLNAHSSESGLFGDEEAGAIIPAIEKAKSQGVDVEGPLPPDTVFVKAISGQYDVVVAMYHDQGHIPLKLNGFRMDPKTRKYTSVSGVNATIGLPIIRTSVDHGTAFGKAGNGTANEESLLDAIDMAIVFAENKSKTDKVSRF